MRHRPPDRASRRALDAGAALLAPSPERLRHGRVSRSLETIADSAGGIGQPYLAEDTLARMLRRDHITLAEWHAGERFRNLFQIAGLDPLRAADLLRSGGGDGGDQPHAGERARRLVHEALDALGGLASPCGSVAWFVLGCELSLHEWSKREGWSGHSLRHETATITLVGALGVLAAHFRTNASDSA